MLQSSVYDRPSILPIAQPAMNKGPAKAHKAVRSLAVVAGAAAAGYSVLRIIRAKQAPAKEAEKHFNAWLEMRLAEIERTLELGAEQFEWLRDQIRDTTHFITKVLRKGRFLKPSLRDIIELAMEQRFLKMKMKIHKKLDLKAETHLIALHAFYEDLRERLFPSKVDRLDGEIIS